MKNIVKQSGFTIPELIVTIVFIGFAFIGISQLYLDIDRVQSRTAYTQIATHAAQTEIESLRNADYNSLAANTSIDFSSSLPSTLPRPYSGTAAVTEPMAGLKRVDVTVTYTDHGATQNVELTSLIGIIGISQ